MIQGQEVWKEQIRVLSVEGQPSKAVLAQTCTGVVFIPSVSDTTFAMLFLPKTNADSGVPPVVLGTQFEKQCSKLSVS
jgi:hypothetical protein